MSGSLLRRHGGRVRLTLVLGSLATSLLVGCVADRGPDASAAGPGHTDEVVDATDLHYVPTRIASAVGNGPRTELSIEPVGDGYRFSASADGTTFEVAVDPTGATELRQSEVGGTARRAAYELDEAAHRITWTDALAAVAITAPGAAAAELQELADSMLLVDSATYGSLLEDPGQRFASGEAVLARLPLADRSLRVELTGSLAESGLTLGFDGLGPSVGTDASLIAAGTAEPAATQLSAWMDDGRNRAVLLVPDGFVRLSATPRDLRWWQAEDARLGRIVLFDAPGDQATRVTVEVEGQADQKLRIDPMAWS